MNSCSLCVIYRKYIHTLEHILLALACTIDLTCQHIQYVCKRNHKHKRHIGVAEVPPAALLKGCVSDAAQVC